MKSALADLQAAERGLLVVSGEQNPSVQAARATRADVLSQLGRNAQALALVGHVDPVAYQASTSDPGRAAVLKALKAHILLCLRRRAEDLPQMREAIREMRSAGVPDEEIAPYLKTLSDSVVATK